MPHHSQANRLLRRLRRRHGRVLPVNNDSCTLQPAWILQVVMLSIVLYCVYRIYDLRSQPLPVEGDALYVERVPSLRGTDDELCEQLMLKILTAYGSVDAYVMAEMARYCHQLPWQDTWGVLSQ